MNYRTCRDLAETAASNATLADAKGNLDLARSYWLEACDWTIQASAYVEGSRKELCKRIAQTYLNQF